MTDPKLVEEVDSLKEKVRTAETIWNDLEIQNTTLRKQLGSAQQQVQVIVVRDFIVEASHWHRCRRIVGHFLHLLDGLSSSSWWFLSLH